MILLSGNVGESSDGIDGDTSSDTDSDVDANRPVSPCNFVFIGANTATGKSSLRSKPKAKKVGASREPKNKDPQFISLDTFLPAKV